MTVESEKRKALRKRQKRRQRLMAAGVILFAVLLVALVGVLLYYLFFTNLSCGDKIPEVETTEAWQSTEDTLPESDSEKDKPYEGPYKAVLDTAHKKASMYDYTGAVSFIKESVPDYSAYEELTSFISKCEAEKLELVRWNDNTKIPHIFFHSLIADAETAFSSYKTEEYNEVMTTVEEFEKIIQILYDEGYVLVHLSDICAMDPNTGTMKMQGIYLPEKKKPIVISLDDLSYYDYMTGTGFASRLVINEEGKVVCEMDHADGTRTRGNYDAVPILDAFIEEHPDFSYHGAKGTIALTGYNGVFGYRTSDISYGAGDPDWPSAYCYENPNIEADKLAAKAVADALKADGWKFASHTWGHMNMSEARDENGAVTPRLRRDTEWWKREVASIVGDVDILIYAYGADIGSWRNYSEDNLAFMFLKEQGFNYFCNVDSSVHAWVQYSETAGGSGYFRQGRRNIDGQLMYKSILYPEKEILSDLFDPLEVFDRRRPLPVKGVTIPEGVDTATLPANE